MSTQKLIISAAITGGEHGREANPHLPLSTEEIAHEAIAAHHAGAAIVHIHVWDEDATPTQDVGLYQRVYEIIEAETDLVVNVTTGPGGTPTEDERLAPLSLRPELASFDAGTLNFGDRIFANSPAFLNQMAIRMKDAGTKPELEIFDLGMVGNCLSLRDRGLLEDPLYFQFVLGVPGGAPATVDTLLQLVRSIPESSPWSVTGVGRHSLPMALSAIALGGHVRVGLEDSVYYRRGELATSNAQLVARIARIAGEAERQLATPGEARAILGIAPRKTS